MCHLYCHYKRATFPGTILNKFRNTFMAKKSFRNQSLIRLEGIQGQHRFYTRQYLQSIESFDVWKIKM